MEAKKQPDGTWEIDGLEPWQETFETMCENLRNGVNFKFARYGDGEIFCMDGKIGRNCDKHEYFPDLGLALHRSLEDVNYMVGIQPLSVSQGLQKDYFDGMTLYNADVLHNASIKGLLQEFLEYTGWRKVILVGPKHLEVLWEYMILIPDLNCWTEYPKIKKILHSRLRGERNWVVLLCASMMSEVLINDFKNSPHTFIDMGSVLSPYAGVKNRRYHQTLEI